MNLVETQPTQTPQDVIATVSRIVTKVVDRLTGDRSEVPLMVAAATHEALLGFGIKSQVMYGPSAWVEVLEDHSPIWAGCWGDHFNFWVATQFGEVVDLNASVAHRKRSHSAPHLRSLFAPPMLWSVEVPGFYRYQPEGVAELELTDADDAKKFSLVLREVREKCNPVHLAQTGVEFANEPLLITGRRILDDSQGSFKQFDRALSVHGIPAAPPFFTAPQAKT